MIDSKTLAEFKQSRWSDSDVNIKNLGHNPKGGQSEKDDAIGWTYAGD